VLQRAANSQDALRPIGQPKVALSRGFEIASAG
jgi:hypothetical protein